MQHISQNLAGLLTKIKNELDSVDTIIKDLPEGRLACEKQRGTYRFEYLISFFDLWTNLQK